jgi:hypothetical protein
MTESGHENVGLTHYVHFGVRLGFRGMVTLGLRFARAVRELFRLRAASLSEAARDLRRDHDRRVAQLAAAKRIGVERLRRLLALQAAPITSSIRGIMASVLLDRLALGFTAWACLAILPVWAVIHYALTRQRSVDPSRQLADRAAQLATLFPAAFIVMGHTHVPQTIRAGAATYINVGSWAEHEEDTHRAARTHLVIHVTPSGPEAQFCTWGSAGPEKVRGYGANLAM